MIDNTAATAADAPIRAAQYLRMSTDHQRYSTENQAGAIQEYAERNNILIVRTYADEGISGLTFKGRPGIQRLVADVESGNADFELVIVYDVSRWGRFQDVDESIYYEVRCRLAGVRLVFCGEQFANEGLSGILCLRRLSLDYKTLAENDSELSFCLEPFTRRPFPVASCLIEHEI
ncbi:recombinase family protein [Brucella inopinata]|uniref:recombinase family protein n=1 Tax=Brucella inopinata TaxID=1218315 RepID=UPI0009F31D03